MDISWHGHACFRIRGKEGTVVCDPLSGHSGFQIGKVTANIVTISHQDPFHAGTSAVGGDPTVFDGPGEYEASGIPVIGIRSYRDKQKGAVLGKNTIFIVTVEEVNVAHLGGLGHTPTADQVEQMGSVDVLLVPVGGHEALDAAGALETIGLIQPKVVIPMHYKVDKEIESLETVERFLKEMGVTGAEPVARYSTSKSGLPDATQVVVLNPS